jgi:hypothetical protein
MSDAALSIAHTGKITTASKRYASSLSQITVKKETIDEAES